MTNKKKAPVDYIPDVCSAYPAEKKDTCRLMHERQLEYLFLAAPCNFDEILRRLIDWGAFSIQEWDKMSGQFKNNIDALNKHLDARSEMENALIETVSSRFQSDCSCVKEKAHYFVEGKSGDYEARSAKPGWKTK